MEYSSIQCGIIDVAYTENVSYLVNEQFCVTTCVVIFISRKQVGKKFLSVYFVDSLFRDTFLIGIAFYTLIIRIISMYTPLFGLITRFITW